MDDLERQRQLRREREQPFNVPNCENCLQAMRAVIDEGASVWRCDHCGTKLDTV